MKKWIVNKPDFSIAEKMHKQSDLSILCAEVLVSRGIDSLEKAKHFLKSDRLEDPFKVIDMKNAVNLINDAVEKNIKICIYGDYDCDGITSTVMLYSYLECLGADVTYYIPERCEGYGMNKNSVKKISESGVKLIITVDNGISASDEADYIYELGMKLIVTDHHQPGNTLPKAEAVLNPHRIDCPSSFKPLCGAGVVLKLIAALDDGNYDAALEQFGELAAIGTVADIVKLEGENRLIVENGLLMLKNTERAGLLALLEVCGLADKEVNSTALAFMVAPRINASGRFGSPGTAVELLLSDDIDQAEKIADELNRLNNERKKTENIIMEKIEEQLNCNPERLNERVLIFSGENWHHGVIGIVASRLVERFGKPCFVITVEGNVSRGSVRSFGEFSVFKSLSFCAELLIRFGGHLGAGGFSVETTKINELSEMIKKYAFINHPVMPVLTIEADKLLLPEDINEFNIESLKILEPFGEGNHQPLFMISGAVIDSVIPLSNGVHTKLKLAYGEKIFYAFLFRTKTSELFMQKGEVWDFIVSLEINSYKNTRSSVLYIKDYRKSSIKQTGYFSAKDAYEKYLRNETLPDEYYPRICPSREEMVLVYKSIPKSGINTDTLFMKLSGNNVNYCKIRASIDILNELKLVEFSPFTQIVSLMSVSKKVNLETSENLMRLRSKI